MAVTSQQILDFLIANPGMSDTEIAAAMQTYNVTPAQMAQAVGLPVEEVQTRYKEAAPSVYTAENVNKLAEQILSQGTTEKWTGGLPPEKAALYMADELAKSGVTDITQVAKADNGIINVMTGDKLISGYGERTGGNLWSGSYEGKGNTGFGVEFDDSGKPVFYTQGASSSTLKNDILKLAAVGGAIYGLGGFEGLLGGATGGAGLTTAELAQLDLALGGAGGTAGATALGNALATGAAVPTLTNLTGGSGVLTGAAGGITADSVAAKLAADAGTTGALTAGGLLGSTVAGMGGGTGLTAGAGGLGLSTTGAGLGAAGTGAGLTTGALTGAGTGIGAGLGTTLAGVGTGVGTGIGSTLAGVGTGVGTALGTGLTTAATGLGGLTAAQLGSLLSGGLTLGGGLMQSQTSREAAQQAQARIDAETAAAKQAAQFRPVGMTTRFGTSEFKVDPVTGQLISAGYTLSPEAKNAQDRLVKLAESGLQQAEGAQQQFAPLQTGAQRLFGLGNQYLAQTPEQVAQNYMNQQLALLQPGRELELANLQNKLQQQGRGGLAVSQGGSYGATTPELQALYNARAMQEAQLAAQAQQAGQQQVQFGAGLLGTGAQTMGNYYAGQQAAYQPYTTALGQVQGLEAAAQQPFTMGAALGQQAATAGANVGRLGLAGAEYSTQLATGQAATNNPYAGILSGLGASPAFGTAAGSALTSLFG